MAKREVHIVSYFSLPTDLAGSMRNWEEFRGGKEYSVDLQSVNGESVTVRLESGDEQQVAVVGASDGLLFDLVLGRAIHELGAHSDNLLIYRQNK